MGGYGCGCMSVYLCVHSVFFFAVKVLELEDRKGEWGFKALKQMMKIMFRKVQHVTVHNTYIWMCMLSDIVGVSVICSVLITFVVYYHFWSIL